MTPFRTAIASHRGGAFLWPENSLAAFRGTAGLALEQAECDVHATADGEAVVIHDATLDRTTMRYLATRRSRMTLKLDGCHGPQATCQAPWGGMT